MGTALGAAGNMNLERAVEVRRGDGLRSSAQALARQYRAEAQIGAPAQATTCRRGSSARTIKPSASAAVGKRRQSPLSVRPMLNNVRPGAVRSPLAPAACGHIRSIVAARSRRHGRRQDRRRRPASAASRCIRFVKHVIRSRRGIVVETTAGWSLTIKPAIAERNAAVSISRARRSRPCRAKTSSSRVTAIELSFAAMLPIGWRLCRRRQ